MKCYIYRSKKKQNFFIYFNKKDNTDILPKDLSTTVGELEYSFDFDLTVTKSLARENPITVMQNLKTQGYHVQVPPPKNTLVGEFKIKPSLIN